MAEAWILCLGYIVQLNQTPTLYVYAETHEIKRRLIFALF